MTRILVTGGAGFVGRHLVKHLTHHEADAEVTIVDNLSNTEENNLDSYEKSNARISFYRQDIRSQKTLSDLVKRHRIDTCIHLAAKVSVSDSMINPSETIDVNVNGTNVVLAACAENQVQTVIFASSAAVYGEPKMLPIAEDHALKPLSPYGESKMSGEALLDSFNAQKKIKNVVSLRFFNIFGEGQNPTYAGVITKFAERLSQGLPPIIYGTGEQTRDFISVNDVAIAILLAVRANISGVFNIGSGRPTSINELARNMIKMFDLDLEPIYKDPLEGDILHSHANVTRAKDLLRFAAIDRIESRQSLLWLFRNPQKNNAVE